MANGKSAHRISTMSQKTIIFDFDGTIADTLDVIVNIYNQVAHEFECKIIPPEERKKLQAKRFQTSFKEYGVTNFKLPLLLLRVRKELHRRMKEIKPIQGMIEAVQDIQKAGFNLGIMTSNSKANVEIFLAAHKLEAGFDFIYSGRNIFGKDKVIAKLLRDQKIEKSSAVYVGDETRDIEAAKKVGISVVAVSWGFNSREILAAQHPTKIVDHPQKLLGCLRKI